MHYLVLLDSKIAKKLDYLDYRFILKKLSYFLLMDYDIFDLSSY